MSEKVIEKTVYEKPDMEIVRFETEDIITTSFGDNGELEGGGLQKKLYMVRYGKMDREIYPFLCIADFNCQKRIMKQAAYEKEG